MRHRAIALMLALILGTSIGAGVALADNANAAPALSQSDLVKQANAPISSLFQIRLQDSYAPAFQGALRGQGNFFSIAIGMPLPQYRFLPFPQLSLLTIPAAGTLPLPLGSSTGFGDIRFVDLAILDPGHSLLFGIGASDPLTFAAIVLLVSTVAFIAAWLPARRAMRVDPIIALRAE